MRGVVWGEAQGLPPYSRHFRDSRTASLLDSSTAIRHAGVMSDTKITVRMDETLAQRLKIVAVTERKTVTQIVVGLVSAYVERKEKE